jgi:hypothetical protein
MPTPRYQDRLSARERDLTRADLGAEDDRRLRKVVTLPRKPIFLVICAASALLIGSATGIANAVPASGSDQSGCQRTSGASSLQLFCQSIEAPVRALNEASVPDGAPSAAYGHSPADLHAAYALPNATTTATVAIVDAYGDPNIESYLKTYRSSFGLPACTRANTCLRVVNQAGKTSPLPAAGPSGWQDETALDVEMVSAICRTCHILLVQTNDDDGSGRPNLETGVKEAVALGAKYVSMSWGRSESSSDSQSNSIFATKGVAYVAAAGDDGYGTMWPAATPYVAAVGGTSLTATTGGRDWSETAWDDSMGATGSGCAQAEGKPVWQTVMPSSVCPNRAETDVSVDSDPVTGVAVYSGGAWKKYGGTSAAAPMIAAIYAMAGTPRAYSLPAYYPYANATSADLNDVTSGNNNTGGCTAVRLCYAGAGWDGPTGLGTPDGLNAFKAPAPSVMTVRNPGSIHGYAGTSVKISVVGTSSRHFPVAYYASGLPSGVTVNANGTLTSAPRYRGTYNVTVTTRDVSGGPGRSTTFRWTTTYHHLVPSSTPKVTGSFKVGHKVTLSYGTFRKDAKNGAKASPHVRIQWYANGHKINGATHASLTLKSKYRHEKIAVHIVASRTYYFTYRLNGHSHKVA